MKGTTMFLATTRVPAAKSIGEITQELTKAGATAILQTYTNGKPSGLRWSMKLYGQEVWFELPVKIEPVFQKLYKGKKWSQAEQQRLRELAERVAWRQLLMWVKLQMALVEIDLVEFGQVFLPFHTDTQHGQSVWSHFKSEKFKMLEPPKQ